MNYSLSIIIPTYKPGVYLFECLDSVCYQMNSHIIYEILIVLNGPLEPYYEALSNEFLSRYSEFNIRLLYCSFKGVSNARNLGINEAKGKYLFFLDDDDVLSNDYFNQMLRKIEAYDEKTIVVSNVYSFYRSTNEKNNDYLTFTRESKNIIENRKYLSNSCCKLIPKEIIGERRFNVHFTNGEDALFMFSISDRISNIVISSSSIYFRRLRENSASRKKVGIFERINRIIKQQIEYTIIYFRNPFKYNFILYLTRLLAVFKQ